MTAIGWIVLTKDGNPGWMPDWDGEVHTDGERASRELADCRKEGHQAILGIIVACETPHVVNADDLAAALTAVTESGFGENVDDDAIIEEAARAHLDTLRGSDD